MLLNEPIEQNDKEPMILVVDDDVMNIEVMTAML